MVRHRRKKGITPLIASFILLSFAVAVGTVVMNVARAQVEEQAVCPVELELQFSNTQPPCYDAARKEVRFTVQNGINTKIKGLIVSIIGAQKAETADLQIAQIERAGVYTGSIPYDASDAGSIRQVRIIPKIDLNEKELVCAEKAVTAENLVVC